VFEVMCFRVTMLKEEGAGRSNECLRAWLNVTVPPGARGFCVRNTMNSLVLLQINGNCLLLASVVNRFVPRAQPQRYGMSIAYGFKFPSLRCQKLMTTYGA
jgi:hypothetical protein